MNKRQLTVHLVPDAGSDLTIDVMDEPGAGGACHRYNISAEGPAIVGATHLRAAGPRLIAQVNFQDGPIGEYGQNGVTHEALLAIVIDRLEQFQAGRYACDENADALKFCGCALAALKARTAERVNRAVEGTSRP